MDVRFINPFVVSIREVLKTMADVEVRHGKPKVKDGTELDVDVSGIIGFSGDTIGACVLCFPLKVACSLASSFAGEEMTIDHPDFRDAIGELANMVSGHAKGQFVGISASISLPSVVVGNNHEINITGVPDKAPRLIIPCETDTGSFYLEIAMICPKAEASNSGAVSAAAADG